MIILNKTLDRGTRNPQGDNPMHFRRLTRQTLPTVATVLAAACLLALSAPHALAQSTGVGSGSSGSSLLGTSSGIGTGTGSSSTGSLTGGTGSSGNLLGNNSSTLSGSSLSGSTNASSFRASTNGVGP